MNYKYLFNDKIGVPIFGASMSLNRFRFLHAVITFDDAKTRDQGWIHDRFAVTREIFEIFNNCSSLINPDEYIALHETLYACNTQINSKKYDKHAKYDLLSKSLTVFPTHTHIVFLYTQANRDTNLVRIIYTRGKKLDSTIRCTCFPERKKYYNGSIVFRN